MYKLLFCIVLYVFLIDYSHCYSKLFGININNNVMGEFCVFVVDSLKKGCDYTTIHESYYGRSFYEVKRGGVLFCIFSVTNHDDWVLTKKDNIRYFDKLKIRRMLFIINNDDLNFNNCFSFVYCKIKDFIYLNTQIKQFLCFFIKKIFVDVKNSFCINISNEIFNITCPIFKKKSMFVVNNSFFSVFPSIKKINVLNVFKPAVITKYDWRWPTDGKIIDHFSAVEGGNKGIDISGSLGQPILAAANGKVIYAGNALRGYGNLIIIQHSNDYLSAYAHNELILVSEHQKVEAGQKIATMGHTETNLVKLHFEIRYKGKSVNPLCYLP